MKKPLLSILVSLLALCALGGTTAYSQANHLVIGNVNGGVDPQAGVGFNVVVVSEDISNLPTPVLASTTITLTLKTGNGTLGGTLTGSIVAGTDTVVISGVTYTMAEGGVSLTATASGGDVLASVDTTPFTVLAGPATKLAFGVQPVGTTGGATITPAVTVRIEDAQGNTVTTDTRNVSLAIGTNPPGTGILTGGGAVAAVAGVATFGGLSIDKAGNGYTLVASSVSPLTNPISNSFNITAGAATKLAFGVQPVGTTGGATITPAVTVRIEDALGNLVTTDTRSVSLAIGTNPPGTGILTGGGAVAAVAGVATFGGLSIDKAGNGYTLVASSTAPLTNPISNPFNITVGVASKLAFGVQPSGAAGGATIAPAVTVLIQDAGGNTVTTETRNVSLAIGTNPPGTGVLTGGGAVAAVAGVATFGGLSIDKNGSGYTLVASSVAPLTNPISNSFNITVGAASKLAFGVQPSAATGGATIAPAVTVLIQDAGGNTVTTETRNVSLAIGTNPPGTGILAGGGGVAAVAGVATFGGLSIDKAGNGYTLVASSVAPLTGATSNAFNITAGIAAKLAFVTQPGNGTGGVAFPQQPVVALEDAGGNIVTGSGQNVTLAIQNNAGPNAILSGTKTVPVNTGTGLATFSGLSIDSTGNGYTLTATGSSVSTTPGVVVSSPFNITTGPAAKIAITTQPGNGSGGSPLTTQPVVTLQDAGGNLVTGTPQNVTLAIQNNPGGGALSGTTTVALNTFTGQAVFTNLSIDKIGNGYTLTATGNSVSTSPGVVVSSPFNVSLGGAARLEFGTQPSNTTGGGTISPAVTVRIEDLGGNLVSSDTRSVSLAIGTNPPGNGVLTGGGAVAAVAGVATFGGLSIDKTGNGYTLVASSTPALTSATSNPFNVGAGGATKLVFGVQPSNTGGGSTITPAVTVLIEDAGGNVINDGRTVTVAIGTNPSGGTLTGTTSVAAVAGVATFSTLSINRAGNGYTLTASSVAPLTTPSSNPFNITVGAATKLAFGVQPSAATGGATIAPAVTVLIQDAGGNTVTTDTRNVSLAIGTNPPGTGILTGGGGIAAVAGVATFGGLSIDKAGNGYTLVASSVAPLTNPISNPFTISIGAATKLAFGVQPAGTSGGATIAPAVTVLIQDAGGNTVPTETRNVSLAIGTNPPGTGILTGGGAVAAVAGVATFGGLSIDRAGNGYTLVASSVAPLTNPISNPFNISVGAATKLAFGVQPAGTTGGVTIAPAVTVLIQDAGGNTVTTETRNVSLAIGTNPPGTGILTGGGAVAAVAGVATFGGLSIDKAGNGYTLVASSVAPLTNPISNPFNITVGVASKLAFGVQPSGAAGGATIAPPVTVLIQDAGGNTVTTETRNVSLAIGTNPPGTGVLTGGGAVAAVAGVATFGGLSIDKNGSGYTLVASSAPALTTATSLPFTIATGGLTHFIVEQAGGGAIGAESAGTPFSLRITAKDAGNNTVTSFTGTVNLTSNGIFSAGAGPTTAFVNGVLDPWAVTISNTGSDSITATRTGGSEKGTSNVFIVNSGPVNNFLVEYVGGGAIPQQTAGNSFNIRLTARDANNNTVTAFNSAAILTSNAGLVGTPPVTTANFVNGVLASQSVTVTIAGSANRTITATTGSQSGTSAPFTVVASTPASIAVSAGDIQSVAVGAAFPVALAALVRDGYNNPVNGATVTFTSPTAGASGTWTGGLHSTPAVTNASGVATVAPTFTANSTAGAYVDTAAVAGAVSPALFHLTNTAAAASKLVIVTPPSTPDTAGSVFSTQPVIWIEDASNNLVTTFNGSVQAARTAGTGTLQGLTTISAVNGVATFSNLSYNVAETMTITFSSAGLTPAATGNIVVRPGVPSTVVFVQGPSAATAGVAIAPAVTAQVRDAFANVITTAGIPVTMGINSGTGVLGGTLTQNTNASGIATFADLFINLSGSKTLVASSGTLTSALSGAFTINPAAASRVAFVQEPTNANAGATIAPAVTVQLKDPFGNNATTPVSSVTLALLTGTGTLSGTLTQPINGAGLATFANLSINFAGAKTLRASDGALAPDTSQSFTISALAAKKLVFVQQPSNAVAGASIVPPVTVQVQDSLGNNIAVSGTTVNLTLNGTGSLDGTPPTQITDSFGVATFSNLTVDLQGSKTLTASASGLTNATSLPFTISAAAASKLAFTTQPSNGTAGTPFAQQPVVTLQDQFGNTVTGTAQNVTLVLQANPGADVLGGTTTVPVNTGSGQAAFAGLLLTHAATGYTLTATGNTVSVAPGSVVSLPFNIVHAVPTAVRVETLADGSGVVLPAQNVSSGTSITVYSIARDTYNNFISDTAAAWSLINVVPGVSPSDLAASGDGKSATFTGRLVGSAQIHAVTTGIATSGTSGVLTVVNAGAPSKIFVETLANGAGVVLPDSTIASGRSITVYAIARDNAGNFVRNTIANWSVQNATLGVVAGDLSPSSGRSAVFTGHVAGTGQIRADSAGLTVGTLGTVTVIHGSPASVAVTAGSGQSAQIGTPFGTLLQATVRDSSGNPAGSGVSVTFSAPGTGAGGTFPGGATSVSSPTNASSVATAPVFTANRIAGTFRDTARIAGVSLPALFVLTNTPGGAAVLTASAGTPQHTQIATQFPVALAAVATDSSGNRVPGVSVTFTPPATASSGSFAGGNPTVISDSTGTATAPAYFANPVAGPDTVNATASGVKTPARFILTNDPGGAQNISYTRTLFDTAVVNTTFKDSLQVVVKDQSSNPVSGVWVTFTAPSTGASAVFARTGKLVDSAQTTSAGLATSSALTANTVAGDYQIIARISGTGSFTTFYRSNRPGPVTKFVIESSPGGGPIGTQVATVPFDVLITSRDAFNNINSFPGVVTINITSNAPLTAGGGNVGFNTGLVQTMVFQQSGGSDTIRVVRSGGAEKGASNAFAVINPSPTLASVSPPNGRKGEVRDIVLTGTGFISGTTFPSFGGSGFIVPQAYSVNSSTQMTVTISISPNAPDSAYTISVINPSPVVGTGIGTLVGGFTVGNTPPPKVLSISPVSGSRLQTLNVVIRGTGFFAGVSKPSLGPGIVINSTNVDSVNQITSGITVLAGATVGPRNVVVTTTAVPPGGGTDTLKNGFAVDNPLPTLYSLSLNSGARSHSYRIIFTGSNFIAGVSTPGFDDPAIVVDSSRVDSATGITANLTVKPAAALGAHIAHVTNALPGGGTSVPQAGATFTVVNPPLSLASVRPFAGKRGETLDLTLKGLNFVQGLTRVLFTPPDDITINTNVVDSVDQISANITIGASAALLPVRLIKVYNPPLGSDTSGTVAFTVGAAGTPIPVLRSPANGSQYQPATVTLRWSPSAGATGYQVQLSTSPTFATRQLDSSVVDTFAVAGPLTLNSTYYWHVNSSNATTGSSYSSTWTFVAAYPARIAILDTVPFASRGSASDYLSSDYRLVGLPGGGPIPVANYMAGTAGADWNVVWDNGAVSNYWVPYAAGSPFTFGSGRGFWFVRKGNWIVRDTIASAALDANGQLGIPLHLGFNIITNPFTAAVNWSDVITQNPPMRADHLLFTFPGAWTTATALTPYTGYGFYNSDSLASLKIPFRSGPVAAKSASSVASGSWKVSIDLDAAGKTEQLNSVGTSPEAVKGLNPLDYHRPRGMKGIPTVVLNRPSWDPVSSEFATDIRPPVQTVEAWDFEVRTTLRTPVRLSFRDVGSVPGQFQVLLLDQGSARSSDLRSAMTYTFTPATDVSAFTLLVGTPEGVRTRVDELLPKEFALGNAFPNPFNPETTIPVAVPYASQIRLVVYNILGAEVRTLYDGSIEGGKYWFRWDGRNQRGGTVSSGVYFVRLTTAAGRAYIQKMAFVK